MSLAGAGRVPVAVRGPAGETRDVLVPGDAPLAAVLAELGLPATSVDTRTGTTAAVLRNPVAGQLPAGAELGGDGPSRRSEAGEADAGDDRQPGATDAANGLDLVVVAGLASGGMRRLAPGLHRLASGVVLCVQGGDQGLRTWAEAGAETEALPVSPQTPRSAPGCGGAAGSEPASLLATSPPIDIEASRTSSFRRPPRQGESSGVDPLQAPELPAPPSPPTPLSWASLLAPIPIALAMAVFFRPLFALFGLMGPVLVLGRWFEQRRARRKQLRRRQVAVESARRRVAAQRESQRLAMEREAWRTSPHVAHLQHRARCRSVRLWERRRDDLDRLTLVLGVGPRRAAPMWASTPPDELGDLADAPLDLAPVPDCVDLLGSGGLGVTGDVDAARCIVRSMVLQLATLRGPADLSVVVVAAEVAPWDWVKWLPHTDTKLAAEPTNLVRWERHRGRAVVLVVDDPQADVAAITRASADVEVELTVLSMAPSIGELPAASSVTVRVDELGWIASDHPATADQVLAVGLSLATATTWARSLASVEDPELDLVGATAELAAPSLPDALGLDGPDAVARSYGAAASGLPFVLGVDASGLAAFDLVTDGPHALVAGTTGSGKSELLRTLVLSLAAALPPERLSLVLVDFKGGGAFDQCAALPHVAGLITDLDEGLVARALDGLRAEVRAREESLRRGETVASLVVVIDEFAVLAQDYPEVLDGLVDVAARGRSLGMHLVLATQKPSGVVDHRIRANTNLRIALRVQHAHESHDVVGVATAAELDHKHPGRAIVRVGSDDVRTIQVCTTAPKPTASDSHVSIEPFTLAPAPDVAPVLASASTPPLERLADWIAAASPAVSVPAIWTPPLTERCSFAELRAFALAADDGGCGYLLGIADDPQTRRQLVHRWPSAQASLVLFSGDPAPIGHVIGGLLGDVVSGTGPIEQAYVLGPHDIAPLLPWEQHPCIGSVIAASDHERIERLLDKLERSGNNAAAPRLARHVLVAISDIGSLLAGFDDLARLDLVERIASLARTGAADGVHLVFGARTVRDLPHRIAQHVPHRLLGAVADPTSHLVLGMAAPPTSAPMHLVDAETGRIVLVADQPEPDTMASVNRSIAPSIERCPERVSVASLDPPFAVGDGFDVAIGVRYDDLEPATWGLRGGRDFLIAGPPGSGRTTALAVIRHQVQRAGIDVFDLGTPNGPAVEHLIAGFDDEQRACAVAIVDDVERLGDEDTRALTELLGQPGRSTSVVVATTIEATRAPRSVAALVRAGGNGLLTGGSPLDGEVFRLRRPDLPGLGRIPGRATLVTAGRAHSVQLAVTSHTA